MSRFLSTCAALLALLPVSVLAAPDTTRPVCGPPWFEEALIYYNGFEDAAATVDTAKAAVKSAPATPFAPGFRGSGLLLADKSFALSSAAFSPHRPLTLSFWWALPRDLPVDGAFGLFSLNGKGMVAAFTRGKGEWCALERPTGVAQVYYFQGIQNVNDLYERDLAFRLDLKTGVWHHTAAVFRRASTVELYTDGRLVTTITTSGRPFSPDDVLHDLSFGGGIVLDELAILDRALDADLIADYVRGAQRVREYGG